MSHSGRTFLRMVFGIQYSKGLVWQQEQDNNNLIAETLTMDISPKIPPDMELHGRPDSLRNIYISNDISLARVHLATRLERDMEAINRLKGNDLKTRNLC